MEAVTAPDEFADVSTAIDTPAVISDHSLIVDPTKKRTEGVASHCPYSVVRNPSIVRRSSRPLPTVPGGGGAKLRRLLTRTLMSRPVSMNEYSGFAG